MKDFFKNLYEALIQTAACDPKTKPGPVEHEDGTFHASAEWRPKETRRRIEVMVTGDPSRVGAVADAIDHVQKQVFEGADGGNTELRITGFLDGCIHRSKWSKKPFKAAAQARKWHCEQSRTKFKDAFDDSARAMTDAIVLIGHRFDETLEEALIHVDKLREQGTRIHCFHTGQDEASRAAYQKLADATGGVFMQLADQRSIHDVMPIIMAHLTDKNAMLALEPDSEEAKRLMRLLLPDGSKKKD